MNRDNEKHLTEIGSLQE